MRKRRISLILVIAMMLSLIPFSAAMAEGEAEYSFDASKGITISDGTNAGTYKVAYGNPQVVKDNIDPSRTITLFTTSATAEGISVTATHGTLKLRFNGLNVGSGGDGMRLSSELNRNVEIILADNSTNKIDQALSNASPVNGGGLVITCEHADKPGHICDENCGTLRVYGSYYHSLAAISGHNITINGGNIYAQGMASMPGIGLYKYGGTVENLRFNGGNIEAEGGVGTFGTSGIGGGGATNVDGIYIDGGRITAKCAGSASDIGAGARVNGVAGNADNIVINDGTVFALDDGIGGQGACTNIQINGGSVRTNAISIQPVNNGNTPVYRTVIALQGVNTVTRVTDITITGADYYGKEYIFTDANGKIYLYLPKDATVTQVKTAKYTYTGDITTKDDGSASAVFTGPPILAFVSVKRTSDTHADIKFSSNKDAQGYSALREAGAEAPVFDTTSMEANLALIASPELTINFDNLTAGAKDYYIVAKDAAGRVSDPLKIQIPAYVPPQPGTLQFDCSGAGVEEGFNYTIRVERKGGSDGAVSVDYNMEDGTAEAGTHYTARAGAQYTVPSGTLNWADGDSADKIIYYTAKNDNVYNGYLDFKCVLSNPTGGADIGGTNPITIQISDNDKPPTPTGLRAVAGNGQVTLNWDPVKDARYKLYYSTEDGNFTEAQSHEIYDAESKTISGLTNGTTYYFAIKAGHNIYFSELSGSVSAIPKAPVAPPVYTAPKYDVRDSDEGAQSGGGHAEFSKKRAETGETVTFTSNPDIGYESGQPSVYDRSGNPVPVTDNGDGSYSFKMPAGGADVETTYNRIDYFDDVNEDDWFDEASWYCAAHGLMKGTGERQFEGDRGTTRAMLVTVLYNLTNDPDDFESIFDDVEKGEWYSNPIAWAANSKIANGYGGGKFGPNDDLTREQIASILYNYSMFNKYDMGNPADLDAFSDKESISGWAMEPMKWAVGNGILKAVEDDRIAPGAESNRAELAEIMKRYVTRFVK